MEQTPVQHNRAKLALAVMTSPAAAFENILERRLLGTAFVIVAVAGLLSVITPIAHGIEWGPLHFFELGKGNPITWFGLYLLCALGVQMLLKWIGTDAKYADILIIMGWSQICLVLYQALTAAGEITAMTLPPGAPVPQALAALAMVFNVGYVLVVAVGIQVTYRVPFARGLMSYIVVAIATIIAFSMTYGNSRLAMFAGASDGIKTAAQKVATADQSPWVVAGAVGLVVGAWLLAGVLGWDKRRRTVVAAVCGALGAGVAVGYIGALSHADYYGTLLHAQRSYGLGQYEKTARLMRKLVPMSTTSRSSLTADIADTYYVAGKSDLSIAYYRKYEAMVRKADLGKEEDRQLARVYIGVGAVYDTTGDYGKAIQQFSTAAKVFPEFRDPWARLAVTYDRKGDYAKAIEAGKHATDKLGSEAPAAWIALAQAYARTGNAKLAKEAMDNAKSKDDELVEKIGAKPEDLKNAVAKLTRADLRYPLEPNPMQPPPKPGSAKKPAK